MDVTYLQTQKEVKKRFGVTVKTCWIADAKEKHGLTRGRAWNRSRPQKENPCPARYEPMIEEVLRHFSMIA